MTDEERFREVARDRAMRHMFELEEQRERIMATQETIAAYFSADMTETEKAAMRRYLVHSGLASWVIPRDHLL